MTKNSMQSQLSRELSILATENYKTILKPDNKKYNTFYIEKRTKKKIVEPADKRIVAIGLSTGQYTTSDYRTILAPTKTIKDLQKRLLAILETATVNGELKLSNNAHGFIKTRNIKTNALLHAGKHHALQVDLTNAFNQFTTKRLKGLFKALGVPNHLARVLARLNTYKGEMVQGNPASPMLMNILCYRLDKRLNALCQKHGIVFTRYADDLMFSSEERIPYHLRRTILNIIKDEGMDANPNKTYFQSRILQATGISIVNGKLHTKRKHKRNLRLFKHIMSKTTFVEDLSTNHDNNLEMVYKGLHAFKYLSEIWTPEIGSKGYNRKTS